MSECYGCINPNAACPSCKKNFDRMFAGRASTKGHQMNRDREAIASTLSDSFVKFINRADREHNIDRRADILNAAVQEATDKLLALRGAGELLSEAEQVLTANRDGDGSRAATDRIIKRLRAALSPTTLGEES